MDVVFVRVAEVGLRDWRREAQREGGCREGSRGNVRRWWEVSESYRIGMCGLACAAGGEIVVLT